MQTVVRGVIDRPDIAAEDRYVRLRIARATACGIAAEHILAGQDLKCYGSIDPAGRLVRALCHVNLGAIAIRESGLQIGVGGSPAVAVSRRRGTTIDVTRRTGGRVSSPRCNQGHNEDRHEREQPRNHKRLRIGALPIHLHPLLW